MNWYVLYTKPQWEQKIFKALQGLSIEAFCPTFTEVRQWSDRKNKVRKPYFRSYVFVRLTEAERQRVFDVPGVVRYLFWQKKPAVIRDWEMEAMQEWFAEGRLTDARIEQIAVGDTIILQRGLLKDQHAMVEEIGGNRVKLVLPGLGYKVTAKLADLVAG